MKTITAFLLVAVGLFHSHVQAQTTNSAPPSGSSPDGPVRVACVGDSITAGAGSKNHYPNQLQALLGDKWEVKNFGVSATTMLKKGHTTYWNKKAFTDAHDFQPNVVIIMLGTNDTKPQNWAYHDEFLANYKEMVESFKNLASHPRIFVCLPCPVVGQGNYGINEPNLQKEMPLIKQVAADEGTEIIDMHAALADHPEFQLDRVHPDADGDALLAKAAAAAINPGP